MWLLADAVEIASCICTDRILHLADPPAPLIQELFPDGIRTGKLSVHFVVFWFLNFS